MYANSLKLCPLPAAVPHQLPAFFVRSHGLSQTDVGITLAVMAGVVGGMGTFVAGRVANLLSRLDLRWFVWLAAISNAALVPFFVAFFLIQDIKTALFVYLVPAFFAGFCFAPTLAMIQSLVRPEMRSIAAAVLLFVLNIIGLGFGPQGVGIVSDLLATDYGKESLRYSLMIFSLINIWSAAHYFLAAKTLKTDVEEAKI